MPSLPQIRLLRRRFAKMAPGAGVWIWLRWLVRGFLQRGSTMFVVAICAVTV